MEDNENNEIDIFELIEVIWDGKWFIAGLTALLTAPAAIFLVFIYNPGVIAQINFTQLNSSQMSEYQGLNAILPTPLTASDLSNALIHEYYRGEVSLKIVKSNDKRIQKFDGTAFGKTSLAANIVRQNLKISIPNENEEFMPMMISYTGVDEKSASEILTKIIEQLNQKTHKTLLNSFYAIRNTKEREINFQIAETEQKIENLLDDYYTKLNARKEFLAEQLTIANTLEIADNIFVKLQESETEDGNLTTALESQDFYMRGYKAIGIELDQLNARSVSREEAQKYIDEYPELRAKLVSLKTDLSVSNLDNELKNSPLVSENPKFINYDENTISTKPATSKVILLGAFALMALVISMLTALMKQKLSRRKRTAY